MRDVKRRSKQSKGNARTVKGIYYPSFSEVENLLQDFGCLHFKFSILVGISKSAHSNEELSKLKQDDTKTLEFEGKEYTKYELSQMQRKTETAIRHAKDRQIIAKSSDDDTLRREEQEKINLLTKKYAKLCKESGLPTKVERMSVSGFRKVKTHDELLHLPDYKNAIIPDEKFTEYILNQDHAVGKNKAIAFEKYLGYNINNKDLLMDEIKKGLATNPVTPREKTVYGKPFEVIMELNGMNGKVAKVKTGWIIDTGKKTPRLVSAYVDEKKRGKQ